jgi:hypothetical protein
MDFFFVSLRLIHFVCGVFWAGGAFFNALLLEPAVSSAGPEGQKTMGAMQRIGFAMIFSIASGLTMLSGLILYYRDSGGFDLGWIGSASGIVFTVGAVAAIAGAGVGGGMVGRAVKSLTEIGAEIGKAGGKPTDAQAAQIAALRSRMQMGTRLNAVLLLLAVIAMAVAPDLPAR